MFSCDVKSLESFNKTRDSLLDLLVERVHDVNSFTRVAVLRAWAMLAERNKAFTFSLFFLVSPDLFSSHPKQALIMVCAPSFNQCRLASTARPTPNQPLQSIDQHAVSPSDPLQVPMDRVHAVSALAADRLQDKAANVRKAALQVLDPCSADAWPIDTFGDRWEDC